MYRMRIIMSDSDESCVRECHFKGNTPYQQLSSSEVSGPGCGLHTGHEPPLGRAAKGCGRREESRVRYKGRE